MSTKFQQELFKVSRELQELSGLFINARRLADAPVSDNDIRCALYEYNGNIFFAFYTHFRLHANSLRFLREITVI